MTTNHFYIGCGYFKNIHIGETQIIASQNDYGNLVSFLEKRNTKSVTSIGFCRITKFIPNEEMVGIEISYGRETVFFQFENENDYFHFFEELQIKCNLLNPIYTKYGKGSFDAVIESIRDSLRLFFTFLILFCFLLLMLLPKRSSRRD